MVLTGKVVGDVRGLSQAGRACWHWAVELVGLAACCAEPAAAAAADV